MTVSRDITEPTERTSLLTKDVTKRSEPAVDPNGSIVSGSTELENGGVEQPENNPLFEGNSEAIGKLYLFLPAVALGVSWSPICRHGAFKARG
jgi:hypothetical protein